MPLTTDVNGNTINERYSQGIYAIAEAHLYRETTEGKRGLYWFLHYGRTDHRLLQVGDYMGGGLIYTGLIPGRGNDHLGLGVASARNGKTYLEGNPGMEERETIWELAYRAEIFPWLQVQPDIQYIVNPGTTPAVENATVMSLRFFVAI